MIIDSFWRILSRTVTMDTVRSHLVYCCDMIYIEFFNNE